MKTNQLGPVKPPTNFRVFLQAELARRCRRSPQYSLRAFARFLELDHSTLSQLLRGKRRLTERTIRRCGIRLGLDEESIAEFTRTENAPATGEDDLHEIRRLASDTAILVSEWQHYAILELVRLRDFKPDIRWIARVLGLKVDEVNIAIQRLLHLGLLSMDSPQHWSDRTGDTATSIRGFTQAAIQKLTEQSKQRLLAAVGGSSAGQAAYCSTTLAVPHEIAASIAQRIEEFHRELVKLAHKGNVADDVYQLELSFVPLTRLEQEEHSYGTTRDRMANRDSEP